MVLLIVACFVFKTYVYASNLFFLLCVRAFFVNIRFPEPFRSLARLHFDAISHSFCLGGRSLSDIQQNELRI